MTRQGRFSSSTRVKRVKLGEDAGQVAACGTFDTKASRNARSYS